MARVSGLISGLDTDSLIQELVSAYQTKQESYVKKQTKLEWTQEIWKNLNTKVYSFYTGTLRNARFSNTYNLKKATVSDSTKATVTASNDAVVGTQTLKVKQLAKTAYLTGGKVKSDSGAKLTGNNKLSDLAGLDENSNGIIKVSVNGKDTEITVDGETTINQFVTKLKDAGLNANFDTTNQRLFVSAKNSGADNEFSLIASNAGGLSVLSNIGLSAVSSSDAKAYQAAAGIDVQQKTDTAYTKYVLTQANNKLSAEIGDYDTQINRLQDQLKYKNDPTYKEQLEKSWEDSIQSYEDKNAELNKTIQEQLDFAGNDTAVKQTSVGDLLEKNADGTYVLDADGQYSLKDEFYTDVDGVRTLDETKLKDTLSETGLTSEQVLSQLGEINANVAARAKNDALIKDVQDIRTSYQEYAGKSEETIQGEIDNLIAQKAEAQENININNGLMTGIYSFEGTDGSDIAYTDADGTEWTYEALRNRLNEYSKPETGAVDDSGNPVVSNSIGNTGLTATSDYMKQYQNIYDKYDAEQKTGEMLYDAYTVYTSETATEEQKKTAAEVLGIDTSSEGAVRVEGSDAEIVLNGATFTSNTNNFSINGLVITATGETADDEEITINTTADIDGMYDTVKKFISGYNEILKEMNTLYYADSSKGYEPLTDDEKDAMTDTEIEKWEKKIKDSLLRRDDTLSSIMSSISNCMLKSYTINGKNYSLSSFGISTAGYFSVDNEDRGTYHIDGDSEDSTSSGNTDKLRSALASDPDAVIEFFQKLSNDMYSALTKKMSRTSLSSSYTIYNDKQMQKQYEEYDDMIDQWDEKIDTYTEKYVKQFTAMETAMAKLQSSTSQLSSILG